MFMLYRIALIFVPTRKDILHNMNTYPICYSPLKGDRHGAASLRFRNRAEITVLIQWNLSFGTPLLKGHLLHSGDTKFGPEKMFTYSSCLLPLLNGHLYSGEKDTFCGS